MGNNGLEINCNSFSWSCVIGVNSGYDLVDQKPISEDEFAIRYGKVARKVHEDTGVYISAVITKSRVVYHEEWGCPKNGEYSYTLSGCCNPAFSDPEEYLAALKKLAKMIKQEWNQTTLLVEIIPSSAIYFKDTDK